MIKLQERDKQLLKYLSVYGILNMQTVDRIYGNTTYATRRKKRLIDERYIHRHKKLYRLAVNGKKCLNNIEITDIKQIPGSQVSKIRMGKIAELMTQLDSIYKCYPSWEIKDNNDDKKALYYGKIENKINGNKYYVYNIGRIKNKETNAKSINMKKRQIQIMKSEINMFIKNNLYDRVIILAEDAVTMGLYKSEITSLAKEQLLLPFNDDGVNILKAYGQENINLKAVKQIYGSNYGKAEWAYADYAVEGNKQAIVLINNDIEKIVKIKQYINMNVYNYTSKTKYVLICLEEQEDSLKNEFPNIEIKTISEDILRRKGEE